MDERPDESPQGSEGLADYLTLSQVAKLKKFTYSGVYRAVRAGELPSIELLGVIAVRRVDALAWKPLGRGGDRSSRIYHRKLAQRAAAEVPHDPPNPNVTSPE